MLTSSSKNFTSCKKGGRFILNVFFFVEHKRGASTDIFDKLKERNSNNENKRTPGFLQRELTNYEKDLMIEEMMNVENKSRQPGVKHVHFLDDSEEFECSGDELP